MSNPCPIHYTNVKQPVALLMPAVNVNTGAHSWVWETPEGRTLTEHTSRSAAVAAAPFGYRLLDDAWRPIS
jgi:hypothetical protein